MSTKICQQKKNLPPPYVRSKLFSLIHNQILIFYSSLKISQFQNLCPGGSGDPDGVLADAIKRKIGKNILYIILWGGQIKLLYSPNVNVIIQGKY